MLSFLGVPVLRDLYLRSYGEIAYLAATAVAGANAVGTIGILTSVANQASGSIRFSIFYTPMSDGAYVTAVL